MVVYLFFYSAKCAVYFAVVGFVFFSDFVDKSHEYSEAATEKTNHNFSRHPIIFSLMAPVLVGMGLRL